MKGLNKMKISTRINGRVTSINVRNSVCALHYIICCEGVKKLENHVLDTCHDIISTWKGATARGLSSYITDQMLEQLLDDADKDNFHETIQRLENA